MSGPAPTSDRVSVVLIGGTWGVPQDWQWVARRLAARGLRSTIVDLPSMRRGDATRADDIDETRRAITEAGGATIVAGWSYGGSVISDAAFDQPDVERLVYVAAVPQSARPTPDGPPSSPQPDDSHLVFPNDQTCVLDDEWWLTEGAGATLPPPVLDHLRHQRRRPMSLAALTGTQTHDAWRTIPTTIVLGRDDDLTPSDCQEWARRHFDDVHLVDSDHFILFRAPDLLADIISNAKV